MKNISTEVLQMALLGIEKQRADLDIKRREILAQLSPELARRNPGVFPAPKKRNISAAARKRIGDAARRRWKAFHAANEIAIKSIKPRKGPKLVKKKAA